MLEAVGICGLVIAVVSGLYLIARRPLLRLLVFVGGAMVVLQSSAGVSAPKLGYFALVLLCFGISLSRLRLLKQSMWWPAFRLPLLGAAVLFVLIGLVAVGSLVSGADSAQVARDSLTYVLIAVAPVIGLDAASVSTSRGAGVSTVILAGIASVGFATFWLAERQVSTIGVDRIVLSSMMLSGIGAIAGLVKGLTPRLNLPWLAFGIFCLCCVLVTGTRTGLILLIALLGAVGARRKYRIPIVPLASGLVGIALVVYMLLPIISAQVASATFFQARLETLSNVFAGGVSADASGEIRQRAYEYALEIWGKNPLFGVGFGYSFPNPNPSLGDADFQLDTPILYLAKFGLIGTIVIAGALVLLATASFRIHRELGLWSAEQTVFRTFVFVWLLILPFGTPTEDKGFALALCLTFLMLGSSAREWAERDTREAWATAAISRFPRDVEPPSVN